MILLQHVKIRAFDLPIYIINGPRKRKITSALVQFLAFLGLINNRIVHSFPLAPHPVRSTLTTGLYISEKGHRLPYALVISISVFPLGLIYCYPSKKWVTFFKFRFFICNFSGELFSSAFWCCCAERSE